MATNNAPDNAKDFDKAYEAEPDIAKSYDAEELKAAIAEGVAEAPAADVEKDYAAAQQMSEGTLTAEEAEDLVAPEREVESPEDVKLSSDDEDASLPEAAGDPNAYREMAREVQRPV